VFQILRNNFVKLDLQNIHYENSSVNLLDFFGFSSSVGSKVFKMKNIFSENINLENDYLIHFHDYDTNEDVQMRIENLVIKNVVSLENLIVFETHFSNTVFID